LQEAVPGSGRSTATMADKWVVMENKIEQIVEKYFNIVHFCLYKAICKMLRVTDMFNPFYLIAKIPAVKRRHEKLGIDVHQIVNDMFEDKHHGRIVMYAGGFLWTGVCVSS